MQAAELHKSVGQTYDGYPYELHLKAVVALCKKHLNLIDEEDLKQALHFLPGFSVYALHYFKKDIVRAAEFHDSIEDARLTYNDLAGEFNQCVAELVYRCTNEKGRNREERASNRFYSELKEINAAVFIKACDRLANMYYSKMMNSSLYWKYVKEYPKFKEKLFIEKYQPIFDEIETLL